jgi:hypothetical protein
VNLGTPFVAATVDLRRNLLDLNDPETLAIIADLQRAADEFNMNRSVYHSPCQIDYSPQQVHGA